MKRIVFALALAVLIVPAIGAAPQVAQTSAPRDLTAHDAALADVQAKSTAWAEKVTDSDSARAAYDQALANLNSALQAEEASRIDYETAQQAYATAYAAVEKEDKLAP